MHHLVHLRWVAIAAALAACSSTPTAAGTGAQVADAADVAVNFKDVASAVDTHAGDALADTTAAAPVDAVADVASDVPGDTALAQTCPGAAGCSCASASDCGNGLCLDTPDGKRCATPCGAGCGKDLTCASLAGAGGKSLDVCIAAWGKLCYPCSATKDCEEPGITGSLCVDEGTLGSFCGAPCKVADDCPTGYDCQVAQSPEGPKSLQCVRVPSDGKGFGTCSCTAAAKAGALATGCYAEQKDLSGKVVGKCPGTRMCGPTGLGACTLVAVKPDVCDGIDNDCNGAIDDNASGCGSGQNCIAGKCVDGCGANNGGCDAHATCSATSGGVQCKCNAGFSGDGKTCAADCALPWGGSLASGQSVTAWQSATVACGGTCASELRTCSNGVLSGSNANAACTAATCSGQCPAITAHFDWGTSSGGPCQVDIPAGTSTGWYYTNKTDAYLGGLYATCDTASGTWQFQQQKCVPSNGSSTCFVSGTKCDGSGPAVFPYPHCWTCCTWTDAVPGVCK